MGLLFDLIIRNEVLIGGKETGPLLEKLSQALSLQ